MLVLTRLCEFAYIFSEHGGHKLNQKHSRCLYRDKVATSSVGTKKKKAEKKKSSADTGNLFLVSLSLC